MNSRSATATGRLGLAASILGMLISGCASPIKSVPYASGQSFEGLRYNLSKTTVKVTARARLAECAPHVQIELLPFAVTSEVSADPDASFVINPRDSVNWFRTIDVPELKLTADGRIASAKTEAKEQIAPTILAIAKAAIDFESIAFRAKSQSLLQAEVARWRATLPTTPAAAPVPTPYKCSKESQELVDARAETFKRLGDFRRDRLAAMANVGAYDKDSDAKLKAFSVAESQLQASYEALDAKLVKQRTIELDSDGVIVKSGVDLGWGWIVQGAGASTIGCDENVGKKDRADEPANLLCVHFESSLNRGDQPARIDSSSSVGGDGTYGGVFYRVAGPAQLKVQARVKDQRGGTSMLRLPPSDSALKPRAGAWVESRSTARFELSKMEPTEVLQFGPLARMPGDVGLMTSNSISTTFDGTGAPQTVNWHADPVAIAALLSLPSQIAGLRPAPPAAPSASAELQNKLLLALLQSCIDAAAGGQTLPAYCATLSR